MHRAGVKRLLMKNRKQKKSKKPTPAEVSRAYALLNDINEGMVRVASDKEIYRTIQVLGDEITRLTNEKIETRDRTTAQLIQIIQDGY